MGFWLSSFSKLLPFPIFVFKLTYFFFPMLFLSILILYDTFQNTAVCGYHLNISLFLFLVLCVITCFPLSLFSPNSHLAITISFLQLSVHDLYDSWFSVYLITICLTSVFLNFTALFFKKIFSIICKTFEDFLLCTFNL